MDEKVEKSKEIVDTAVQHDEPAWYDFLIKIVQDLLELNMHSYKKEKVPRL